MGRTGSWRGECHVPQMAPRDLCLIEVLRNDRCQVIGPISPDDFEGNFKGVVRAVNPAGSTYGVTAAFADPRITQHRRQRIAVFDDREPPFPYRVTPRYRMQGMTTHDAFELGDACLILIGTFPTDGALCKNPGMSPEEIRLCCPPSLMGTWKGRIIQPMRTGYPLGASTYYSVAAVLDDERLSDHADSRVSDWMGLEPPMRYQVWKDDLTAHSALAIADGWNALQRFATEGWQALREEARALKRDLDL